MYTNVRENVTMVTENGRIAKYDSNRNTETIETTKKHCFIIIFFFFHFLDWLIEFSLN